MLYFQLLLRLASAVFVAWLIKFLLEGAAIRLRLGKLKNRGLPVPEPYSMLFGHLLLMKQLREGLPPDAHSTYSNVRLVQDWKRYFPTAVECPPVIYLDLWPLMSVPFIYVISPELCSQLTQEDPQPRHPMFVWAQWPLTNGLDLLSMNKADHKRWRSILNPGFSLKSLTTQIPVLVEEVSIFADNIKAQAGKHGTWGPVFTLYDRTASLTFDIITRISIGLCVHEQTDGPGVLFTAMKGLIACCKIASIFNKLERMTPSFKRRILSSDMAIRHIVQPQILKNNSDSEHYKSTIDLALRDLRAVDGQLDPRFLEIMIANMKLFLFAGHETTAQTLCWVLYEIHKYPHVLSQLRTEHDNILGIDTALAKDTLIRSPQVLNELKYTSAVIKETLRLHTPAGSLRLGNPGFVLVKDGRQYPVYDSVIQTLPAASHIHPDLWPEAQAFMPERFLQPQGHPSHPLKNAFRPFELGNTRCIGEELAMMEIKLALVFTIRELEFDFGCKSWNEGKAINKDHINGEYTYRAGQGMGHIKNNLPTSVRPRVF
ncbi:sterigmatocystin biosynthesis P450 monooxygenase StcS [Stachybotrys elegans]|uniref:Sterigmatocystin biosynthesis P450 monooxygenase StcS n=1 Tax=Stachybotrys elegans TaxID=80388 RepID=A0A8K0SAU9_9HYPO|nr:sterigmatocystin biosynthesis P450 monooxygenase StcS [Stachybotrys elegans]